MPTTENMGFTEPPRRTGSGEQAETIVDLILRDLKDRSGLDGAWDQIDDGIQAEIRDQWMLIARRVIERG